MHEASWKLELLKPYRYHFLKDSLVITKLLRNSLCAAVSYFEGKLIKTKITSARFEKVVWIFVFFEPITKFGMHSHSQEGTEIQNVRDVQMIVWVWNSRFWYSHLPVTFQPRINWKLLSYITDRLILFVMQLKSKLPKPCP